MPIIAPASEANAIADFIASRGATFALHTGNPGPAGTANEASGSGYNRVTGAYTPAVNGSTATAEMLFAVPAGTFTHMTRWNGSTLREVIDNPDVTISPAGEVKATHTITVPYTLPA